MRKLPLVALAVALAFSTAALAQADTVTVDLGSISEELAAELGIDVDDPPSSIDLPADFGGEGCGVGIDTNADTCLASVSTEALLSALSEGTDNTNDNSAREFAPGQQDGPANEAAPGQQDGHAKDFAPGQVKNGDDGGADNAQENGNGSAPGREK